MFLVGHFATMDIDRYPLMVLQTAVEFKGEKGGTWSGLMTMEYRNNLAEDNGS
jgi:hypothetical protein